MVTLYTFGKEVEITYADGNKGLFENIIGIIYRPGRLSIVWSDYTMKTAESPAYLYKHIACPGCFDIDIE